MNRGPILPVHVLVYLVFFFLLRRSWGNKELCNERDEICASTCNVTCIHGMCSNFKCECDFGWTGQDCNTKCKCNGHGYCSQNATVCQCKHNTYGKKCQYCLPGYFGNARKGGTCNMDCGNRVLVSADQVKIGGHFGAFKAPLLTPKNTVSTCLWIFQAPNGSAATITFHKELIIKIKCLDERLVVYDGMPKWAGGRKEAKTLLNICGWSSEETTLSSTLGVMTVIFRGKLNNTMRFVSNFAAVPIESICPNDCWYSFGRGTCNRNTGICKCYAGWTGPDCGIRVGAMSVKIRKLKGQLSDLTAESDPIMLSLENRHIENRIEDGILTYYSGSWHILLYDDNEDRFKDRNFNVGMPMDLERTNFGITLHPTRNEIYISGGISKRSGSLLSDLWSGSFFYNGSYLNWKEHKQNKFQPPGKSGLGRDYQLLPIAGHTLSSTQNNLYLIGGVTAVKKKDFFEPDGTGQTNTVVFHTSNIPLNSEQWYPLKPKVVTSSLFGHSTIVDHFAAGENLISVGGWTAKASQIFPISNQIHVIYNIQTTPATSRQSDLSERELTQSNCGNTLLAPILGTAQIARVSDHLLVVRNTGGNLYISLYDVKQNNWITPSIKLDESLKGNLSPIRLGKIQPYQLLLSTGVGQFFLEVPTDLCQLRNQYECNLSKSNSCLPCVVHGNDSLSCAGYNCPNVLKLKNENGRICSEMSTSSECRQKQMFCKWCGPLCSYNTNGFCIKKSENCTAGLYDDCPPINRFYEETTYDCRCREQYCIDGSNAKSEPRDELSTCVKCLKVQNNLWSETLEMCLEAAIIPLLCHPLDKCEPFITSLSSCHSKCAEHVSCAQCQQTLGCGWCSISESNGLGKCSAGTLAGAELSKCSSTAWHYAGCPSENECENEHHDCNKENEECEDLVKGFQCRCRKGFKMGNANKCLPVCEKGCGTNGRCIGPNKCKCNLGWTGASCDVACNCSGFSDCPGPDDVNTCLNCKQSTAGKHCESCKYGYVRAAGKCMLCSTYCNDKSTTCVKKAIRRIQSVAEYFTPTNDKVCKNCKYNSGGDRCEICQVGYYKVSRSPKSTCTKCQCNGHSSKPCDAETGGYCQCQNNTKSSCVSCPGYQCDTCIDGFVGTPSIPGAQCFQLLDIDTDKYFDTQTSVMCGVDKELKDCVLKKDEMIFVKLKLPQPDKEAKLTIDIGEGQVDIHVHTMINRFKVVLDHKGQKKIDPSFYTYAGPHLKKYPYPYQRARLYPYAPPGIQVVSLDNTQIYTIQTEKLLWIQNATFGRYIIPIEVIASNYRNDPNIGQILVVIRGQALESKGLLYYQQFPAIQFKLFTFFTVFAASMILLLVTAALIWQLKQWLEQRAPNLAQMFELDAALPTRPLGKVHILLERVGNPTKPTQPAVVQPLKAHPGVVLATMMIKMPGGKKAPTKLAVASALVLLKIPEVKPINKKKKTIAGGNKVHPGTSTQNVGVPQQNSTPQPNIVVPQIVTPSVPEQNVPH